MVGGERLEGRIVGQVESRDLPSSLALGKEPGEQIYRRVNSSSPFGRARDGAIDKREVSPERDRSESRFVDGTETKTDVQ